MSAHGVLMAFFAAGFEHREENLSNVPDPLVVMGYAPGTANPTQGAIKVNAIYAELNIPVIAGLTITPSARHDDYDLFGASDTYKIGGDWQVIPDLRVRAAYNTGFRAPSLAELFGGSGIRLMLAGTCSLSEVCQPA